jgi:general secretion pathway protein D
MRIFALTLLLSFSAFAEDPPPLPPNPFSNLPANPEAGFNPFEDEMDEQRAEDMFGGEKSAPPPRSSNSGSGGGITISTPRDGGGKPKASNSVGLNPANAKDIVENFDYPDAEILDVAKAISKLTGRNFIYNPQDIKGRISVVSETSITVGDAWNAFLTALNMRGFALVPSGKYLRIERVATAKEKQTPIYSDRKPPNNDEFITRVIPLRYIDATEFEQTFRLWMPREARMQAYGQTNTLIITDTAVHINRMMELISLLDVAGYQESLVVLPIKNAAAKDIAKLIEQIISEGRGATSNFGTPARPTPTYNTTARPTARKGRSGGSVISKIIADDRTNVLIVKANAAGIMEIRALVRRLDTKVAASEGSGRIHVIRLQFADAETLAKTLSALTTGSGQRTNSRAFPAGFGGGETSTSVFQGELKVSADKTTQSLVVTASPQDFSTLKKVVESLDQPRDQVYIEAMILEMKLNRDNAFGTSFVSAPNGIALPGASGGLASILAGNPFGASGFALGFKSGKTRSVGVGDKSFQVNSLNGLVELIQGNTDANVVATPQIIALDNEKATFEISEQIQIPTTSTANNVTTTSFQPDKAQLLLEVTPQINKASSFVKLDINQKLENFDSSQVPKELQGRTQGKNTRSTNTKVIVQNEDTVVLSGLIRDSVTEVVNKVPLLGDIPVLGWLFKNSKAEKRKTNLVIFITPRIIKQYDTVRKILNDKFEERDEFTRENFGSSDPMARQINKLKKRLPDLTVIEPLPQARPLESSSFNMPSPPDREDEEGYYDPNGYYPPDGGSIPIPPIDVVPPQIGPDENMPAPPAIPEPSFGE